jgi:DNA polymerase delta subunit 2
MYFARLAQLKPAVDAIAAESFADFEIAGETASRVDRVLDVRQGELCWVTGTVYMELPLKPNILDDIGNRGTTTSSQIPQPRWRRPDDVGG